MSVMTSRLLPAGVIAASPPPEIFAVILLAVYADVLSFARDSIAALFSDKAAPSN